MQIYDGHEHYPVFTKNYQIPEDQLNPGDLVVVDAKIVRWKNGSGEHTSDADRDEWVTWKVGLDMVSVTVIQPGNGEYVDPADEAAPVV